MFWGGFCPSGRTVIRAIVVSACVSTAGIAVANDADPSADSTAKNSAAAAPSQTQSAAAAEAATRSQPSASENSAGATGAVPPAADALPASLAIPEAPLFGNPVIEKAAVPPAPAPVEPAKSVAAAPPPAPTPAELLGLTGKDRAKAEKCLANAIYFESRGEPVRGQVAVAQVVMNRVFSPYYPKDVCSVVYQNAERHLACQFTFACDGLKKTYSERGAWWRAQRIAKQTLDGKVWLASVAKATHYHAYWVNPSWVAEMKKLYRFGVHTFYRPHRWGDGAHELGWVHAPLPTLAPKPKPQAASEQTTPIPVATTAAAAAPIAPPPKAEAKATPKIDAKASEAKAAASKQDAKATPAKVDGNKKTDSKISPIYTDGKRSDAKPAAKTPQKASAKSDPKAQSKAVQLKPTADTKTKPKSAVATPAKSGPKQGAKTANDQAKSTQKL